MQIQCPKCNEWTDDETGTCTLCGGLLYEMATQDEAAQPSDVVTVSDDDVVKTFLRERRSARIRSAIRFICIAIGATGSVLCYWGIVPLAIIPAAIALCIAFCIKIPGSNIHITK